MDNRQCTCSYEMHDVTSFGDTSREYVPGERVDDPLCPEHGDHPMTRGMTFTTATLDDVRDDDEPDTISDVDTEWDRKYDCCDDPSPRVHDRTGRFFCGNCRRWLDQARGDSNAQGDATDATPVDQTGDESDDA